MRRVRWWLGYNLGVYWLTWRWQAYTKFRNGERRRCRCGRWTIGADDLQRGVRCSKPELHVGSHRMVIDP